MKESIILFGGGNQLQYALDIIEKEEKYVVVGIVDSINSIGSRLYGYEVIGRQEEINDIVNRYNVNKGIITVGDNWTRKLIYDCIVKEVSDFAFVNAIHPSVVIGNNVIFGCGIVAMAGCIFNTGSRIGDFSFFATGAQIEHDCEIGNFASISAGTIMGGHVKIGDFTAITLGVIIMDRVSIGFNTVVGAGSLVLKSIPDNVVAYGVPVKIIRERNQGEKFLK